MTRHSAVTVIKHIMATAAGDSEMTIVLLGKTGSGKSSLGNTILEESLFKVCHRSVSGTTVCQSEIRGTQERRVQLIDTPGFFDTNPDGPDMKKEVLNCMIECASGVNAFLLVLKVERFTQHEQAVADLFSRHFSEEALKYTTVVFTQGDQLKEGVTLKEWIKDNHNLSTLVEKCGGRCHVFDNKYWKNSQDSYRSNQFQLKELFKTIDVTVEENGGKGYTNENLEKVEEKLKEEKQSIKAAPENAAMSEKQVEEKAKANTFKYFWPWMAGGTVVAGLGTLLGIVLLKR